MKTSKLSIFFVSFIAIIIGLIVIVAIFGKDNTPAPEASVTPSGNGFNQMSQDLQVKTSPSTPQVTTEVVPDPNAAPAAEATPPQVAPAN